MSTQAELIVAVLNAPEDHHEAILLAAIGGKRAAKMITKKEAASIIGCSQRTVERYSLIGEFSTIKLSPKRSRFLLEEVLNFTKHGMKRG
jgi:hypothetical protein